MSLFSRNKTTFDGYIQATGELQRVELYLDLGDAVLLAGPTGCGKTTMVEELASRRGQELVTVVGSPDLSLRHLVGGYSLDGSGSVWRDGPLTRAVKNGLLFYLDEADRVTPEALAVFHSVIDHRRTLFVAGRDETCPAAAGFRFIASYNPCGRGGSALTEAFRQRCRFVGCGYLPPEQEENLLQSRTGIAGKDAAYLVKIAEITRTRGLVPCGGGASTRLLLFAGAALSRGVSRDAVLVDCIIGPLSDDPATVQALMKALQTAGLAKGAVPAGICAPRLPDVSGMSDDAFFDTVN